MGLEYFSHDADARNDEKILNVRMKYGAEGYGIYFMLLERLRTEKDYTGVADYNALAFDFRVSAGAVKDIINNFGLFSLTDDGGAFYSESLIRRMEIMESKSKKRSEAGKKAAAARWGKGKTCEGKANAMQTQSEGKANAMQNKIKEKKRKEIDDDDREDCAQKLASAIGGGESSSSSSNAKTFLEFFDPGDWENVIERVKESKYLQANLDLEKEPSDDFIRNLLSGAYKTYKVDKSLKSDTSRTSKYTAEELDAMAAKKRDDFIHGSGHHSGASV